MLGLVLCYVKSSALQLTLCPMFGLVPSSVQLFVDYGMEILFKVIKNKKDDKFNVKWPDEDGISEYNESLVHKIPNGRLLKGIFGVVDGVCLPCADSDDADLQNVYYEGYTSNVEVTNLFVFNFFG